MAYLSINHSIVFYRNNMYRRAAHLGGSARNKVFLDRYPQSFLGVQDRESVCFSGMVTIARPQIFRLLRKPERQIAARRCCTAREQTAEVETMAESDRCDKRVARALPVAYMGALGVVNLLDGLENIARIANELLLPNTARMIPILQSNLTWISS